MTTYAQLATRYARRPLLLEPNAAREIIAHLQAADPRGMQTERRFNAVLRRLSMGQTRVDPPRPAAMEDDGAGAAAPPSRPAVYYPLWAQQTYGEPQAEGFAWSLCQGVAMMEIATALSDRGEYFCGTWFHGYDTILAAFREAADHPQVRAIFVRMDSPGGVVAGGLAELSAWMRENGAAAGGKPIWCYADLMASAAYWIGAQADAIWAPKVGLVGSIGTVITHTSYAGQLAQDGIEVTAIEYPPGKTDGAFWKALSERARADLEAEIRQCTEDFFAEVYTGRPQLTPAAQLGFGARVFMGVHEDPARSAQALGLVDQIGSEQEAFQALLAAISEPLAVGPAAFPLQIAAEAARPGAFSTKEPANG